MSCNVCQLYKTSKGEQDRSGSVCTPSKPIHAFPLRLTDLGRIDAPIFFFFHYSKTWLHKTLPRYLIIIYIKKKTEKKIWTKLRKKQQKSREIFQVFFFCLFHFLFKSAEWLVDSGLLIFTIIFPPFREKYWGNGSRSLAWSKQNTQKILQYLKRKLGGNRDEKLTKI